MKLGFTKSKEDSNLCLKVEGGRPVVLLLYVDDLFLTEKSNSLKYASRDFEEVQDNGLQGHDHTYGIEIEAIECCFIKFS